MKGKGFLPGFHLTGGRGISICAMDHSFFASLHRAKATGRPRSDFLPSFPREDILELDIAKNGLRFGHEIEDHLVTFAGSLNDHLLDLIGGRGIFGVL